MTHLPNVSVPVGPLSLEFLDSCSHDSFFLHLPLGFHFIVLVFPKRSKSDMNSMTCLGFLNLNNSNNSNVFDQLLLKYLSVEHEL